MDQSASQPTAWQKHFVNFDIDNYLNFVVPRPRLHIFPTPVSHFLGYRPPTAKPQQKLAQPYIWLSALIGGFIGIAIITNVYHALPLLDGRQAPIVIASFGAAAVLEYNTIESPLSQPRNLIFGHFLSAVIGVAITKAFQCLPVEQFDSLRWLAGALSVGVASAAMGVTKTIHPPAGATALLASTTPEITVLGWWLLPLVLLGSVLMTASALVVNNLTRRWPNYWWTPVDLSKKNEKDDVEHAKDEVKADTQSLDSEPNSMTKEESAHIENLDKRSDSETTVNDEHRGSMEDVQYHRINEHQIRIESDKIIIPDWMELGSYEKSLLQVFQQKIQQQARE